MSWRRLVRRRQVLPPVVGVDIVRRGPRHCRGRPPRSLSTSRSTVRWGRCEMDDKERTLNEAMLCVMSALFVDMSDEAGVSGDEVRRAMWPKGVPKIAEVVAR